MSGLDWEHLRLFTAVLETGSLSGAARSLGLAQPTVRRGIEALEASLGVALFTRNQNGLAPTKLARELLVHAESMAIAADAFRRSAASDAEAVAGTVRVSASEIIAAEVLPPMLAALRRDHPALVVILSASNRQEDLLRREADVAVRMAEPRQSALVAKRIGAIELGLFGRPDLLDRIGRPATFEELRGGGMVGVEHDNDILRGVRARGTPVTVEDFAIRTDSDLTQLAAIRAGCGIGVCQTRLAQAPVVLERVLDDQFALELDTYVVMHEDLRTTRRVRAVFDALVAGMARYVSGLG